MIVCLTVQLLETLPHQPNIRHQHPSTPFTPSPSAPPVVAKEIVVADAPLRPAPRTWQLDGTGKISLVGWGSGPPLATVSAETMYSPDGMNTEPPLSAHPLSARRRARVSSFPSSGMAPWRRASSRRSRLSGDGEDGVPGAQYPPGLASQRSPSATMR